MQAVAHVRESQAHVLMLSKKQWFEPRRMGSVWVGGVQVFVCVELVAAAEWPRKRTQDREHGRCGRFVAR
jgi:hypothetical protein